MYFSLSHRNELKTKRLYCKSCSASLAACVSHDEMEVVLSGIVLN